ncbi:MAG: hypothetical protein WDO19_07545 [Bacteroidota bacterium]
MKARYICLLLIVIVCLSACSRAFTPYDAANHRKGMKCRSLN